MSLKILASIFLNHHLSQTFESYQRVKIYTYSVNDLGLNFFTVIWNIRAFYCLQIEHYALKIAFCVQCYSVLNNPRAYYSVYGVNSYTSLNRNDYLYVKVAYLGSNKPHGLCHQNLCKGGNLFLQLFFLSMGSICTIF